EVTLQYEVKNDGPSGIGKVELWLTNDDGQNWRKYREESTPVLSLGSKHRSLTTDLPGEGTYGLCLVVLSKAGLGKRPPQPNDPPSRQERQVVLGALGGFLLASRLPNRTSSSVQYYFFHLMSWPYLPDDFDAHYDSAWVWLPNTLYDPVKGHELYREYINTLA